MFNLWANNGNWGGPPSAGSVKMEIHYVDEEIAKKGGENVESSRSRKVPEIRRRLLLGLS